MIERPRLIPAVILGAMGLIALKVIGWSSGGPAAPEQMQVTQAKPDPAKTELKGFTKMMATARAPYNPNDPDTTGSVPAKPKKEAEAKEAETKAAEAKALAEAKMSPNAPRDRSNMINTGERPPSISEKALLERLGERRDELDGRMRELELREKLLETVEKKVEGRVDELKQIEGKIGEANEKKNPAEAAGLKNLVVMYESMKPKDAARIFDRLSIDVLLPVVQQMNPRKMSEVLAAMSPEAAEKLTVAIASRAGAGAGRERTAAAPGLPSSELQAIVPARPGAQTPAQPPAPAN